MMKLNALAGLILTLSSLSFATVFQSSSGQETYETETILEPADNEELKEVLQNAYDAMQEGDHSRFPLALGAGGYYLNEHWQGVSFGAHAYGKDGQPYLSTHRSEEHTSELQSQSNL